MQPDKKFSVNNKKKMDVRPRFIALAIIAVFVAVAIVAGARWYGENQAKKNAEQEIQALQEQVESLKKKIEDSENDKKDDGEDEAKDSSFLKIPELGIQVPLSSDISDAVYVVADKDSVYVSVKRLTTADPACDILASIDNGSLGAIIKTSPDYIEPLNGENIQKARPDGVVIDGAYYFFLSAQSSCTDKMTDEQNAAQSAFMNAVKEAKKI